MALLYTTKGEIDESLLVRTEGVDENDNERAEWVEYRLDGELVRRDLHLTLKKSVFSTMEAAGF